MKCKLQVIGLVLALSPLAAAQTVDAATREMIDRLLTRIDTLEKRVADLEKDKPATPANALAALPAPSAQAPPAAQPSHLEHDQAPVLEAAQNAYPLLKITGFGDINFAATDLHGPSGGFGLQTLLAPRSGFQEGQFILHFSSALSSKVSVFSELSLTARPDAGTGAPPATGFNAEVERMSIRYDLNDRFKVSFGRYHTPINYWNTANHHGSWLQNSISRPEMIQFGSSFLPVHFVGALVQGTLPARGLNFDYNVGIGNGRGSVIARGGDAGDVNSNRAWLAALSIRPDSLYGLQVGGAVYRDEVTPAGGTVTREWIQSGHLLWQRGPIDFLAEFSNVKHKPVLGSGDFNSQAFYIQPAYRLPFYDGKVKPYYRFEYMHIPQSDTLFRALPSYNGSTVGTRYDISSFAAFKLEYRYYLRRNLPRINGVFVQTSFTF
jgi:hypothetical protein